MVKQAFIFITFITGVLYAQKRDTVYLPEIKIVSPGLVEQLVKPGDDKFALVIDTTKKPEVSVVDNYIPKDSPMWNFFKYFMVNLKFPDEVVYLGIQGRNFVGFNIDIEGKIVNIEILKKLYPQLDDMVKKILEDCPRFPPNISNPPTFFILPVRFTIDG